MPERPDDFFVGYLPMTPKQRLWGLGLIVGALLLLAGGAAVAALAQTEPAPGAAAEQPGVKLTGLLTAEPYGVLLTYDEEADRVRTVLLSRTGKRGSGLKAGPAKPVTVGGLLLERDDGWFLEVRGRPKPTTLDPAVARRLEAATREDLGPVALRGEIVDSKCWHGRMRPGGGRAHRACAQLCISGGIPPVLVTRNETGQTRRYLLVDDDGGDARERLLPYVSEPVELSGALARLGDLWVIRVSPDGVVRL